jgi:putative hydrolase of the HAD superfamily
MRKPDTEIFRLVIEENGLLPDETLFIDDSPQHIEGARKAGLKTHWLKDNDLHKFMKVYNLI